MQYIFLLKTHIYINICTEVPCALTQKNVKPILSIYLFYFIHYVF